MQMRSAFGIHRDFEIIAVRECITGTSLYGAPFDLSDTLTGSVQLLPPSFVRRYQVFQGVVLPLRSSCHANRKSPDFGPAAKAGKTLLTAGDPFEISLPPAPVYTII